MLIEGRSTASLEEPKGKIPTAVVTLLRDQ